MRVALAHAKALAAYRPGQYAGPTLLLRATVRRAPARPSPERGWAGLAPRLQTDDVEGDHHAIVRPPRVAALAAAIDRWLERNSPD